MSYEEPLSRKAVAISISESADMAVLGLGKEHLRDAMAEVARHLLAMGARLIYGGDLRAYGFTELLFELVARHRRDADVGDERPGVVSYLPWPVHRSKPASEVRKLATDLAGIAELHCLDRQGRDIPLDALAPQPATLTDEEWADGLTAMRAVLTETADARVVLGGRVSGYKGLMPGIAEETLDALKAGQPVFLLGGFGGCARDIAEELKLVAPKAAPLGWPGRDAFVGFDPSSLNNGLTEVENRTLVRTAHVDEAITLILRGLLRLADRSAGTA